MDDLDENALINPMNDLRHGGDRLAALKLFLESSIPNSLPKYQAFRQHFLRGTSKTEMLPCLLLEAATSSDPVLWRR